MQRGSGASTIDKLVAQGIELLEAGELAGARELLTQAVVLDPRNEKAWLWRAGAVETDEERRVCLSRVVAINPHNTVAQRGLRRLQSPLVEDLEHATPAQMQPPVSQSPGEPLSSDGPGAPPRLRRLSVQGPRLDATAPTEPNTSPLDTIIKPLPPQKTYAREMLYWPESHRPKKPIWWALVVGIVIVAFGAYAVLRSLNLLGEVVLLPALITVIPS